MTPFARTRWIGPPPCATRTFDQGRVWRWSERDVSALHVEDLSRLRTPRDPRRSEAGLDEPGLCLFDLSDRPLIALGRLPCLREDGKALDDAVLSLDAQGRWRRIGLATTTRESQTLRDARGEVRAARTWPQPFRKVPVDERERVSVGGAEWQLREVSRRHGGLLAWLSARELVGLELHDGERATLSARHHDEREWRGEIDVPLLIDADATPDVWTLAAFALLVLSVIDASELGHGD